MCQAIKNSPAADNAQTMPHQLDSDLGFWTGGQECVSGRLELRWADFFGLIVGKGKVVAAEFLCFSSGKFFESGEDDVFDAEIHPGLWDVVLRIVEWDKRGIV